MLRTKYTNRPVSREIFRPICKVIVTLENIVMNYIEDNFQEVWEKVKEKQRERKADGKLKYDFRRDCRLAIKLIYEEMNETEKSPIDRIKRLLPGGKPYQRLDDIIQFYLIITTLSRRLRVLALSLNQFEAVDLTDEEYVNANKLILSNYQEFVDWLDDMLKELYWKISHFYSEHYNYKSDKFTLYAAGVCISPLSSSTSDMKRDFSQYIVNHELTILFEERGLLGDFSRASRLESPIREYIFKMGTKDGTRLASSIAKSLKISIDEIVNAVRVRRAEIKKLKREKIIPLEKDKKSLQVQLNIAETTAKEITEVLTIKNKILDEALSNNSLLNNTIFIQRKDITDLKIKIELQQQFCESKASRLRSKKQ